MGYVYLLGLLPSLYGFTGYDGCTHMYVSKGCLVRQCVPKRRHAAFQPPLFRTSPPTPNTPLKNDPPPNTNAHTNRSEETQHASTSAPRGMVYTCIIAGLTGLVYILGLLYSTTDIDEVRI